MRRTIIAVGTTLTGLVLLLSWPTSLNRTTSAATPGTTDPGSTSSGTSLGTSTDTSVGTSTGTGASTPTTSTYDGAAAATQFGNVQVRITVTDGVLTAAEAIDYPNGNSHDQQISSYAIPVLNQEAVAAQSASIGMVSGATYTSDGYVTSLQSALDQAGL